MSLHSVGAADALLAKHGSAGTALAVIQMPDVPAVSPGRRRLTHDVIDEGPSAIKQLANGINVRKISPREMSDFSLDLYAAGIISFDDYSVLSEHPELNPQYDKTVGALTNKKAQPNAKRDLVRYWEEKLGFASRYAALAGGNFEQAKRIVGLMRYLSRRVLLPG